jgi:hypothetical protein
MNTYKAILVFFDGSETTVMFPFVPKKGDFIQLPELDGDDPLSEEISMVRYHFDVNGEFKYFEIYFNDDPII